MRHVLYLAASLLLAGSLAEARDPALHYLGTQADLFGYYMPTKTVTVGTYKLITLAIGPREDFKKFERGDRFGGTWSPVLLEFAPVSSQPQPGEGGPSWPGSFRVLSASYAVTATDITFAGAERRLGEVRFEGKLDLKALQSEKTVGGSGKIVLRGTLRAGGRTYRDIAFTWFGGD